MNANQLTKLRRTLCLGLALWFLGLGTGELAGQDQSSRSPSQTARAPLAFGLKDDTPVKLRLTRTLSSANAKVGERVDFEALEEIKVNDVVVIPNGSAAWGTVTEARHRCIAFRGAKLNVSIKAVTLADGETAGLRAVRRFQAEGRGESMRGVMVVTGLVFFPALPLFLLTPGNNIEIPKRTEIFAYINGDVLLDRKKFAARPASATPAPPPPAATQPPLTKSPSLGSLVRRKHRHQVYSERCEPHAGGQVGRTPTLRRSR